MVVDARRREPDTGADRHLGQCEADAADGDVVDTGEHPAGDEVTHHAGDHGVVLEVEHGQRPRPVAAPPCPHRPRQLGVGLADEHEVGPFDEHRPRRAAGQVVDRTEQTDDR